MNFVTFAAAAATAVTLVMPAQAGQITPDIIFGDGNNNRGFEVVTSGDLELGLRAKRRYTDPNDQIGIGIVRDGFGNYLIDSTGQTVPSNRSAWNFDWSINSDFNSGTTTLDTYTYEIGVDYDPSSAVNLQTYDPLAFNVYVGDNSTGNGAASQQDGSLLDYSQFNVAQQSVNYGFLTGAPLEAGEYQVTLTAFFRDDPIAQSTINVFVDTLPPAVPLPAGMVLLPAGLGALALLRRRRKT